jgi:(1->4)-alpha-D-glucan 1-alpha-D-glucosylmutase
VRRFAFKVQQFTGPMMAKSQEDTAFYRYHRLIAFNEVGGNPAADALSVAGFHAAMMHRVSLLPHGLTATATHDTKRGEDARARILALTELAEEWSYTVEAWRALNAPLVQKGRKRCPSRKHEYMLYQTLLGAWPLVDIDATFVARMQAYALKASREGKDVTSWVMPDARYEAGLTAFVAQILDQDRSARFLQAFEPFARRIALLGALNSLSQLALKLTVPGVPDFYQGAELWDLALVDPDNRRPVDFSARAAALSAIGHPPDWPALAASWRDARVKLALMRTLLSLRQQWPAVFTNGTYQPLDVSGPDSNAVVAFARVLTDRTFRAFIFDVIVASDHRGRGLGRLLMIKALHGFRIAGLRKAYLEVTARNEHAVCLYRRLGFRSTRTVYKPIHTIQQDVCVMI